VIPLLAKVAPFDQMLIVVRTDIKLLLLLLLLLSIVIKFV
jgi:hypothetical protein